MIIPLSIPGSIGHRIAGGETGEKTKFVVSLNLKNKTGGMGEHHKHYREIHHIVNSPTAVKLGLREDLIYLFSHKYSAVQITFLLSANFRYTLILLVGLLH